MPTSWVTEHVPFVVCLVTSVFTIGGLLILRESWRSGMFSRARAAISTAFLCWKGRRENPVLMYGPRRILSAAGALVGLIVLMNVVGTGAYLAISRSRINLSGMPLQTFIHLNVLHTNADWFWASIAVSAVLFCVILDRWGGRLDDVNTTRQTPVEITFGRFYRAHLPTMLLWAMATAASCAALRFLGKRLMPWPEVVGLMDGWATLNFLAANMSILIAVRLQIAGRSVFTSIVGTLLVTYAFILLGDISGEWAAGISSWYTGSFEDEWVIRYLWFLDVIRSGMIILCVALAFLALLTRDWEAANWPKLGSVIRRLAAGASSAAGRHLLPRTLQFGGIAFLSNLVIGVPVAWFLTLLGGRRTSHQFLETPWDCLRGFVVAGVVIMWYARRKCADAGPREEERQFAQVIFAFVAMVLLTVLYRAALGIGGINLYYAKAIAFISALAVLPMIHVAGSPRPKLALAGWLLAASWFEMTKPSMRYQPWEWESIGEFFGPEHWLTVLVIGILLALRLADRWGAHAVARESMDASAAIAPA